MLRELHISNLAVIADARIELHPGLNCFTGATGAGKSLVIGAIELLLGLRSGAEMLRSGAEEARVSGVFELRDSHTLALIERATDVPVCSEGGEILLTRRLYASGRSSVSLNGHPITLAMLKSVAELLVDVHGQHDHQYLLKPSNQLQVIDHYANLEALREQYHDVYQRLRDAQQRLQELTAGRTLRQQQLELYRFQAQEIDNAEPNAVEFEELRARASVLQNLEKLKKDAGAAYAALYETDGAVLERLKTISAVLSELAMLDGNLKPVAQAVREATIELEDSAFDLGRYLDRLELDPSELAEVNDRLNTINRILSKYGETVPLVLEYRAELARKIAELERAGDDLASLQSQIEPLSRRLEALAAELTSRRQSAAKKLAPLIEQQFGQLGMDKARFHVELKASPSGLGPAGGDEIEFMVQTNPGLPAYPLRKIASGGELSRIMLAIKGVLSEGERISVLVFDEIDANVGGRLGSVIGAKLRELARHHQVLCITHLPQIAAFADRHLTVRKTVADHQTQTTVRLVEGQQRLEELAEMIGGQNVTETTRAQARELLAAAATGSGRRRTKGSGVFSG
ncbi:DNA repair protein RecN [Fontivita pretiosa]|uniref:DNA repair protein RecN n=1 Tax=Fontivita pretiosa TaxID=2989684 RepID=UPI003D17D4AC